MKLLLVEDNPVVRPVFTEQLRDSYGAEVVAVASVAEAESVLFQTENTSTGLLKRGIKEQFDAIVTDYDLGPGETGVGLIKSARIAGYAGPIVLVSGNRKSDLECEVDGIPNVIVIAKGFNCIDEVAEWLNL